MEPVNLRQAQVSTLSQLPPKPKRHFALPWRATIAFAFFIGALTMIDRVFFSAPVDFTPGTTVDVVTGDTLTSIGERLEAAHVVRNGDVFRTVARFRGASKVEPGPYRFETASDVFSVVWRFASNLHGISEVAITIPEGWTRAKMAARFADKLPAFSTSTFMLETSDEEGYLFPDTYRFFLTATSGEVASAMRKNFDKRTSALEKEAVSANLKWSDVVILASILEGEGRGGGERSMIADILNRRIASHMRLQVDAPFVYILGKGSAALTQSDLFTDSPYNTYRHEGLPPTPISNPGIASLTAAVHPSANEYLFYLHDREGNIHYAKTSVEHVKNKQQFLK